MKFLITNDDGIDAPGLAALVEAAAAFGEAIVVAPDAAHSGCGHRVTTDAPIQIGERRPGWWAVSGTPADCTRIGLWQIARDADWVLSGINAGGNLGVDLYMSGTVAAVREGALIGRPGIAFSNYRRQGGAFEWQRSKRYAAAALQTILKEQPGPQEFWNVNLPDLSGVAAEPDFRNCPPATGHLPIHFEQHEGGLRYRGSYHDRPRCPGDDVDVCFSGHVAISRLSVW